MAKKAGSTFFILLISLSVMAGCTKEAAPPAVVSGTPPPADSSTVLPPPGTESTEPDIVQADETPQPSGQATASTQTQKDRITGEVFAALASSRLEGRVMGSKGAEKARSIIEECFSNMGLESFGDDYLSPVSRDPFREIPVSADETDGYNIVGFLKGRESTECLIISAHYDGSQGNAAALDNASGIYCLLKTAEKLSSYSKSNTLARDTIFAAFDGEEDGLVGSGYLADQIRQRYKKAVVINLDCIGFAESDSYVVIGDANLSGALMDSLLQYLEAYHIGTVPTDDTLKSDHISFELQGIPAVTIGERDVERYVHTPDDTPDIVELSEVDRVSEAVYSYVLEQLDSIFEILFPR